jgi:hypothetical protein
MSASPPPPLRPQVCGALKKLQAAQKNTGKLLPVVRPILAAAQVATDRQADLGGTLQTDSGGANAGGSPGTARAIGSANVHAEAADQGGRFSGSVAKGRPGGDVNGRSSGAVQMDRWSSSEICAPTM